MAPAAVAPATCRKTANPGYEMTGCEPRPTHDRGDSKPTAAAMRRLAYAGRKSLPSATKDVITALLMFETTDVPNRQSGNRHQNDGKDGHCYKKDCNWYHKDRN